MKLAHLSLGVSDLAQSERFYGEILGLRVRHQGEDVVVQWADFLLVLMQNPPSERSKFHFGFRVDNHGEVDAWAQKLREHHVQIVSGPAGDDGLRQLFFLDPDQYLIEIYSEE
jgi:catechol 2,3-dioxygenase-like lactoylglutathione lyase family enzyme